MIVSFYNIMNTSYDLSTGIPDMSIDYSNPLAIKEMEYIPGVKSVIELEDSLYTIYGAEIVRYELNGEEKILYACHVEGINHHPTMSLPYNQEFEKMFNSILRKKKIRGILD